MKKEQAKRVNSKLHNRYGGIALQAKTAKTFHFFRAA